MEAFFRSVAIGLGVLMGTLNPGVEPELQLAVHKTDTQLVASGTVVRAVSPAMEEALGEGVVMALTLQCRVGGRASAPVTQTIAYQPLGQEWVVVGPGESPRSFSTRAQAVNAWVTWKEAPLGALPAGAFVVVADVVLTFPGRPDWRSDMVWKTASAPWQRSFAGLSEVPF
jgi:hypothetical protein